GGRDAGSSVASSPPAATAVPGGDSGQCTRWKRPETVAPVASGTRISPAMPAPSTRASRAPAEGSSCRRVSAKLAPSNCRRDACTSIPRNGNAGADGAAVGDGCADAARAGDAVAARAMPIQPSASSDPVRPATTSPEAGGACVTVSLPSTTRTPVAAPLRARTAMREPCATVTSPATTGYAVSLLYCSHLPAALTIFTSHATTV